jgi:hypothetical protein
MDGRKGSISRPEKAPGGSTSSADQQRERGHLDHQDVLTIRLR